MSLFVGLNTGLTAIRAARAGLDTASHNIANANTPGFTRQRVELAGMIPFQSPDGPIGTGVEIQRIARLRDQFLDARVRTTSADFARLDARASLLTNLESVTGEPDNGISGELTGLWDAFEDFALNPADPAVRRQVLSQLDAVAGKVQSVHTAWSQLGVDTTTRRDENVSEVNDLLTQIADINRQVANADPKKISNDLLDRRDLMADRVAELTGATASLETDGTLSLQLGGQALVTGSTAGTLAVNGTDLEVDGTPVTNAVSGQIGALHGFLTVDLPSQITNLDTFVATFADAVNSQHAAGFRTDGTSGGPLFSYTPGSASATIAVAVTSPAELAAAGSAGGGTPGLHDGDNAQRLADLRTTPVGGSTLDAQLNALVVDLGAQVAGANRSAKAAGDLAVAAQIGRQSQHGVSLDEEMVDTVRYQRQLEAASRVMTAIDEALDVLVNRVGVVGR